MTLVLMEGAQLGVPPVAELPGGGFAGLPSYVSLMRRCSAPAAADRPASFTEVITELRWVGAGVPCFQYILWPS